MLQYAHYYILFMKKLLVILFAAAIFFAPGFASAKETIESFDATILIREDALVDVTEEITYDFGDEKKHGIFRIIPIYYGTSSGTLHTPLEVKSVTDENGTAYNYVLEDWGYDLQIRIGSADEYVSGRKIYRISYTIQGVINYFEEHDELYWNVTGNGWEVPINKASATVLMEKPLASSSIKTACYQGYSGSTDPCDSIIRHTTVNKIVSSTIFSTSKLDDGKGLTIVYGFPKDTVSVLNKVFEVYAEYEPGFFGKIQSYTNQPYIFVIPFLFLIARIIIWWRNGRDPKGRGVVVAQFDAPDALTPAQVGTLIDSKANNRDYSAEIIQLAVLGYISITRIPKKGFLSSEDFELALLKDTTGLTGWQKEMIETFFSGKKKITVSSLAERRNLPMQMMGVGQSIFDSLVDKKYYDGNPLSSHLRYYFRGALIGVAIGLPGSILGWMWILVGLLCGFTYMFSGFAMVKRTVKGVEAKEHIQGLQLYLSVAEKDRLDFHNAPDKDAKVFEKLLPYAIVLGVEKQWAGKFASIYTTPPSWYHDPSLKTFNAVSMASSLHSFQSTTNSSFSSAGRSNHASSGGSGFSSGSSGGGYGGGGGGSW